MQMDDFSRCTSILFPFALEDLLKHLYFIGLYIDVTSLLAQFKLELDRKFILMSYAMTLSREPLYKHITHVLLR